MGSLSPYTNINETVLSGSLPKTVRKILYDQKLSFNLTTMVFLEGKGSFP